jgi:ArsR family transcriptional regulator, arsenate/arsenite/antimonite-responsive transcriptional repressor
MTTTALSPAQSADGPDLQDATTHGNQPWQDLADRLHAVADPTRLRLLAVLQTMPHQQGCVTEITTATHLPQPTVSRHLQILHRAALVTRTRHGSRVYYQVNRPSLEAVARDLASPQTLPGPRNR